MKRTYLLSTLFFVSSIFCMEKTAIIIPEEIGGAIAQFLTLVDMSALLRTCTYQKPSQKLPFIQKLLKSEANMDQVLRNNKEWCRSLSRADYTKSLIHYSAIKNEPMIRHIIAHESAVNKENRHSVLRFFGYKEDAFDCIKQNCRAYQAEIEDEHRRSMVNGVEMTEFFIDRMLMRKCLKKAIQLNCISSCQILLKATARFKMGFDKFFNQIFDPTVINAVKNKQTDILNMLCVHNSLLVYHRAYGLNCAVEHNYQEGIRLLWPNNVNEQTPAGETILFIACQNQWCGLVKLLLSDSCIDISLKTGEGRTAFEEAFMKHYEGIISLFQEYEEKRK
jgi:hypothetical protein